MCDSLDLCEGSDDALDADGDGIPDDCDVCPIGDDTIDLDGNGVPDACEVCDDFEPTTFEWVTWNNDPPALSITGTVAGIPVTYTSSSTANAGSGVYNHATFPSSWGVPNNNAIVNVVATENTLTFDSPVVDPVLVFASVGSSGVPVTVTFEQTMEILWDQSLSGITSNEFTGNEGFAIVRIPGVHSSIDFAYLDDEIYVNFVFGAAGSATDDMDGDGIPDVCDPCPTDSDLACM